MDNVKLDKIMTFIDKLALTEEERAEIAGYILSETSMTKDLCHAFMKSLGQANCEELDGRIIDAMDKNWEGF